MPDLFDYYFFYLTSLFFAVLKITAFITWPWWVVALPAIIGLCLFFIVLISAR
jgi:hypothetical protein